MKGVDSKTYIPSKKDEIRTNKYREKDEYVKPAKEFHINMKESDIIPVKKAVDLKVENDYLSEEERNLRAHGYEKNPSLVHAFKANYRGDTSHTPRGEFYFNRLGTVALTVDNSEHAGEGYKMFYDKRGTKYGGSYDLDLKFKGRGGTVPYKDLKTLPDGDKDI